MTRTRQILLFLGACGLFACGGDDDGGIIIADSGPTVDSGPDAAVGCGDYEESADATNDTLTQETGMAEASGISFAAGDSKTVCGVIDPAQANEEAGTVDIDSFDFTVAAGAPLRVVLRSPDGDSLGGLGVFLQFVDPEQGPASVTSGGFVEGYALATSSLALEGTWRIAVFAIPGDTPPAASIDYTVEISDQIACANAAGDPDYLEAKDGAKNRKNDVVSATWSNDPVTKLTRSTTDVPEPTDLTLAAGTPVHIRGTTADIAANDDYHDKDTFALANGDDANEWDVHLTWPDGDIDMDTMAFPADTDMPDDLGNAGGAFIDNNADEQFTVRLPAGASIWVWAGAYNSGATDLPVDYDITICPRTFTP
jgi:hypothetical protein